MHLHIFHRFEPLVEKDYCRYKPVGIQAYGVKWDYSEVSLEPIGNIDVEDSNGTETKVQDAKKDNETFSLGKLSTWLNISSNSDKANSNQFENNTCPSSRQSTPAESMIFTKLSNLIDNS